MRLLLTNDDGINAKGLQILAAELSQIAEVFIVAPAFEQSGTGHGITINNPIRAAEVIYPVPVAGAWAVQGLPADCVKLGLDYLLKDAPSAVISGINHGANLGTDVIYSGTVSGALESFINGCPAIAVSVTDGMSNFELAAQTVRKLCLSWEFVGFQPKTMLNINVPPTVEGIRYTSLGDRRYLQAFEERIDPMGRRYFWLHGQVEDSGKNGETDVEAVEKNLISITPIQFDLTDYHMLSELLNNGII